MIAVAASLPFGIALVFAIGRLALPPYVLGLAYLGLAMLGTLLLIGMAIAIPAWTYRAWTNLHAMGVDTLQFSPGWAAGSFFVPVVNLWIPFVAMRQLANRSFGEAEYHANVSVPDVTSWWACFVAGYFIQFATVGIGLFNTNGVILIVAHPIIRILTSLFGVALLLGAAWFLYRVIGSITAAQKSFTGISEAFA
jgi:hypothetical protein